jgi:hypothetical protein
MADWFQCKPTKWLRGLGGLTDDAQLAYTKALLLIYENDGRITSRMLRAEFPQWRPKRLEKAVAELLDAGKLVGRAARSGRSANGWRARLPSATGRRTCR